VVENAALREVGVALAVIGGLLSVIGVMAGRRRTVLAGAAVLALAIAIVALFPHCPHHWSYVNGHCLPIELRH
jgi:MFS family permease